MGYVCGICASVVDSERQLDPSHSESQSLIARRRSSLP